MTINPSSYPSYGAPWGEEILQLIIDADGLSLLKCQGCSNIDKTISSTVILEDFNTIKENAIKQLNSMYGTTMNGNNKGLEININKFELGIDMIAVKDQPDIGQYVPSWRISYEQNWEDSEEIFNQEIILDATDGKYIEPRITTADLMSIIQ